MIAHALPLVSNSSSAAAFQLAAWEIAVDGTGGLGLDSGSFRVTAAPGAARSLAAGWLDEIASGRWQPGGAWPAGRPITVLGGPGTQGLLTDLPSAVPLPAGATGLVGALAALAGLRRRARRG